MTARPIRSEMTCAIVVTFDAKDDDGAPLLSELMRAAADWLDNFEVDVVGVNTGVGGYDDAPWLDIYCNSIDELDDDR